MTEDLPDQHLLGLSPDQRGEEESLGRSIGIEGFIGSGKASLGGGERGGRGGDVVRGLSIYIQDGASVSLEPFSHATDLPRSVG